MGNKVIPRIVETRIYVQGVALIGGSKHAVGFWRSR